YGANSGTIIWRLTGTFWGADPELEAPGTFWGADPELEAPGTFWGAELEAPGTFRGTGASYGAPASSPASPYVVRCCYKQRRVRCSVGARLRAPKAGAVLV
ncbi:MAG: hypothetical protein WCT05_08415, partial [Lentisphaeria bacterium]